MDEMERAEQEVVDFFRSNSGSNRYHQRFPVGEGHYVQVSATHIAGSAIDADVPVKPELVDFSACFWSGSDNWFRVDNQGGTGFLHSHLHSGSRRFCDHIRLNGEYTLLDLVGTCFRQARDVKDWKFP
jgi:hypothetical protein